MKTTCDHGFTKYKLKSTVTRNPDSIVTVGKVDKRLDEFDAEDTDDYRELECETLVRMESWTVEGAHPCVSSGCPDSYLF